MSAVVPGSCRTAARRLAAAAALAAMTAAPLFAHEGTRALLAVEPGSPRYIDRVHVRVVITPQSALSRLGRRVWIVADMPMHAMQPIQVELTPTGDDQGTFAGDLGFSMPGPWRIEVRVADAGEVMRNTFELRVRRDDLPPDTSVGHYEVDMLDPVRPTIAPPQLILGAAVALALVMELTAVVFAHRRRRRAEVEA
jgi:hypothetical protein